MATCATGPVGRRKLFWATQPDACGRETTGCGIDCGDPGLVLEGDSDGATISTDNWVQGLIVNMLMTDGRSPDTECGYKPGSQGGHWSESYISDGTSDIGTLLRTIKTAGNVRELTTLVQQYAQITLQRLIDRGVARSVEAEASYVSGGTFRLDITVTGISNDIARVGLSGTRLDNGWVWN